MTKRRGRKVKFHLTIAEDPSLWRYESVQEALMANTGILSRLIGPGEEQSPGAQQQPDCVEVPIAESA